MKDDAGKQDVKSKRRKRRRIWLFTLLAIAFLIALDCLIYPRLPVTAPAVNRGENGLWLRYTWYFGEKTPAGWAALGTLLTDRQVKYAYFHVRSVGPNGRLKFRDLAKARALVRRAHAVAPGVQVFAWIYAENKRGDFFVDAANPHIRRTMAEEAAWLVREGGFDGIQWDYEVIHNGDPNLPALLRETRAVLPPGTPLGTCTPVWYPDPLPGVYGWDEDYFAQVAALCDQMAVMGYDSAMYTPRLYAGLMGAQAVHVTRAAARGNPACRVILGVPTYDNVTASHWPAVENLPLALKGIREGLADPHAAPASFAGVAPFAEYTTSPEEWAAYGRLWQGRP